jgi:hypothetical protein
MEFTDHTNLMFISLGNYFVISCSYNLLKQEILNRLKIIDLDRVEVVEYLNEKVSNIDIFRFHTINGINYLNKFACIKIFSDDNNCWHFCFDIICDDLKNPQILENIFGYFHTNKIFLERQDFLLMIEGTKIMNTNHIHKYLFDEIICREICSFL